MADLWETFYKAKRALEGSGSERECLAGAFHEINAGQTTDIPDKAEISWAEVKKGMSKVQISGEQGTLQSSVDIMSDEEVARISECIVTIYAVIDLNEKLDNKMDQ